MESVIARLTSMRGMSLRFGLTAVDQCVSSVSNFAVGVAVARLAGIAGFGGYSLVYAVWLVVAALHRSLVTDLMSIENDLHKPDASEQVRLGLAAELCLGFTAAVCFVATGVVLLAVGEHTFGICFLIIGPCLPFLLAQDYWRWVGFMKARPGSSLANDLVFLAVQFAAFGVLLAAGIHSLALAVGAWSLGAVAGAGYGFRQHRVAPRLRGGIERIRLRWRLSRWLVGIDVISSTQTQAFLFVTGAFLGPIGVAGLKSASNLVTGPSLVLLQAGGSIGLPEASKGLSERGWPGLRRVQRVVTGAGMTGVGLVALVVILFGHRLLVDVYGPAFGRFAGIADIVAAAILVQTLALGAILCLKVTRQAGRLFRVYLISFAASFLITVSLTPAFGVAGAAWAALISGGISAGGLLLLHLRNSRREAERLGPASDAVAQPTPLGAEALVP